MFERKLRPEWAKKQELAVKSGGTRPIQEKITARMAEKASPGRKIGGGLLGFAPGLPFRGKITAKMAEKTSSGRKIGEGLLDSRENYGQIGLKKQDLAVKSEGACWIREKITVRLASKSKIWP